MSGTGNRVRRPGWSIGVGDAATVVAEARKALFTMAAVLAVIWVVQIFNWLDHYRLSFEYGIQGGEPQGLPHILTAPFLHFSWDHIESNSGPLFIFGFLAAYRGVVKFLFVTLTVVATGGLAGWLFDPHAVNAGASGVVFGYFGYIMVRGLFDRHAIDILIGAVMALSFAYTFAVLMPQQGIGWQVHIGGLVGGVLAGWVFRDRRPALSAPPTRNPPPVGPQRTVASLNVDATLADLRRRLGDTSTDRPS